MSGKRWSLVLTGVLGLFLGWPALGQECGWQAFGIDDLDPGIRGTVRTAVTFDDGSGPRVFVGGDFEIWQPGAIAPIKGIASWDGSRWEAVGGSASTVYSLCVYDDGSGPALYAAGSLSQLSSNYLAKWDGQQWHDVGGGFERPAAALAVFDDGTGDSLIATGYFLTAGGVPAEKIAKWDGATWSPLGQGLDDDGLALCVFDDGDGPELFVGGRFDNAGGSAAWNIAKWNGSRWQSLGGADSSVHAFHVFDDGTGPALFVGGYFDRIENTNASGIAKRSGGQWQAVGDGVNYNVRTMASFEEDGQRVLYVGGSFTTAGSIPAQGLARWNGNDWTTLGSGLDHFASLGVTCLAEMDLPLGKEVLVSGTFSRAGFELARNIAKWSSAGWSRFPSRRPPDITELQVFDDGEGPALYAAGEFRSLNGIPINSIARWDGISWSELDEGIEGVVQSIEVIDDGTGPALYVGGLFNRAGQHETDNVAKWQDGQWHSIGAGLSSEGSNVSPRGVFGLAEYTIDGRPTPYAVGSFVQDPARWNDAIASWDGKEWFAEDRELDGLPRALAEFDGGQGPRLYVVGYFREAGSLPVRNIAAWDGMRWYSMGLGLGRSPHTILAVQTPDHNGLYVGGWLDFADDVEVHGLAKWDGSTWSDVGGGVSGRWQRVRTLATYIDGERTRVIVGGNFSGAGGQSANNIAVWDGESWRSLGSGVQLEPFISGTPPGVEALALFDDGSGLAIYAAGSFVRAAGRESRLLARFYLCDSCPADFNGDGLVNTLDFLAYLNAFSAGDPAADFDGNGVVNTLDFLAFLNAFNIGC